MAKYMTRNPVGNMASSTEVVVGPQQFLEVRYQTTGPQEWIFAPDAGEWAVTLFFLVSGGGTAFLEGSDESPFDLAPTGQIIPGSTTLAYDHVYALTDTVSDTTRTLVKGCTAVRVNVTGGTVDVTARC